MTEKLTGRAAIDAEIKRAQTARASLETQLAGINREIAKWDMRMEGLEFALFALGPAPRRGRPAAGAAPSANGERAPRVRKPRMTVAQRAVMRERTTFDDKRSEYDAPC